MCERERQRSGSNITLKVVFSSVAIEKAKKTSTIR